MNKRNRQIKLIVLMCFICVLLLSCRSIKTHTNRSSDKDNIDINLEGNPTDCNQTKLLDGIFDISNEQINLDIKHILSRELESYYKLIGDKTQIKTITFILSSDTLGGRILDVVVYRQDVDFEIYSKELVAYFKGFSTIKCVKSAHSKKVNEYWLLIYVEEGEIFFETDYDRSR